MLLGIDVGRYGAIAVLDAFGKIVEIHDMPRRKAFRTEVEIFGLWELLHDLNKRFRPSVAVLELTQGRPPMSAMSAHTLGVNAGVVLGILSACKIEYQRLAPRAWKSVMGITADKSSSLTLARSMWPDRAAHFQRTSDDGRAEAALLARCWLDHAEQFGVEDAR